MAETTYSYTISTDFPGGAVNSGTLQQEIQASAIVTALERIDTAGDSIDIVFKAALSAGDKTLLDGDTTGPAGGLIAAHDNSVVLPTNDVNIVNTQVPTVGAKRTDAKFFYWFSPNLCDKSTWYLDAVKVTDEAVGTGDGSTTVFNLDCGSDGTAKVLDLYGKVTNCLALQPTPMQTGSDWGTAGDYLPVVTVNGSAMKMDRPHRSAGDRDYRIDTDAQTITFTTAPASGHAIVATYWYVPTAAAGHVLRLTQPPVGKKWTIDYVEAQFSSDMDFDDTLIFGPYKQSTFAYPVKPELHYTDADSVDDYAIRAVPPIDPWGGGTTPANTRKSGQKFLKYWEYLEELSVGSTQIDFGGLGTGYLELNARLEGDGPDTPGNAPEWGGTRATITIRIIEEDE